MQGSNRQNIGNEADTNARGQMHQHGQNGLHPKFESNSIYIGNIVDEDDDSLLDEPFPTTNGAPIESVQAQTDSIAPSNTAQTSTPQPDAAVPTHDGVSHQQAHQHNVGHAEAQPKAHHKHPGSVEQAHHGQHPKDAQPSFKPAPILVPVPNPVGRSKIREQKQRKKRMIAFSVLGVVVVALLFVVLFPWDRTITMNGQEYTVKAHTTLLQVAEEKNAQVDPGDLLAIDGSVIEAGKGEAYSFTVNGEHQPDGNYEVNQGDIVEISDGADITEEFTEEVIPSPSPVTFEGIGAIHKYLQEGQSGESLRKTGAISGITVDEVIAEPTTDTLLNYNAETNGDKVIALTFDDGPWDVYTEEILDILKANDAKATFFTVGERIEGHEDTIKRASDEGHQISTHSWDHASGSGQGVNLGYMTEEEQRQEILKGLEIITEVTGKEASSVVRVPGGNLSEDTARIIGEFATAEIGWNIDTNDWKRPGAEHIFNALLLASPGNVILMHDGGGDRSQTVQALRDALPILAAEGYRFITMDELIENYPVQGEQSSQD